MSVNIYDKVTGELIQIAGNANGVIDDVNVSNKTTYSSEKIEEIAKNCYDQWKGKIACCYGDSIMKLGQWTDIIKGQFGFSKFYNRGISGTTLARRTEGNGVWGQIYNDKTKYDESNESFFAGRNIDGETTSIMCHYWSQQRIETIPADADLILMDVGTNDFFENVQLGEPLIVSRYSVVTYPEQFKTAYDGNTICGGLALTIQAIMKQAPKAKIVIIGCPLNNSVNNFSVSEEVDTRGTKFYNMLDTLKKVALYHGCYFIDTISLMGVNQYNLTDYMADGTHPQTTERGVRAFAYAIADGLKHVYPQQF